MQQTTNSRRDFLNKLTVFGGLAAVSACSPSVAKNFIGEDEISRDGRHLTIRGKSEKRHFLPLDEMNITSDKEGIISVYDQDGALYYQSSTGKNFHFGIGGSLGHHWVFLENGKGEVIDMAIFRVDCETCVKDKKGTYEELLWVLYNSMIGEWGREAQLRRYGDRFYYVFVVWLRDHVHTLKGMKYFYPNLKDGIDLYGDSQREDGMIWDNHHDRNTEHNYWEQRFGYGDFIKIINDGKNEFKRIPAENDVEYLFLEGIYYTWKATGDDTWMESMLDKAMKAVDYSTTSPYRWSEKYGLLKRGFTIDTWDFQAAEDADISTGEGNPPDPMVVKLGNTRFGVMFGDNTGMAAGCRYLAEMLRYSGRGGEAEKYEKLSDELMARLDKIAWNGDFYTHHVPEDPNVKRDFGVDLSKQVSLSNAYSINRTLTPQQCKAIIETYRNIREEMPETSPGEWYTIYPPFERGFGGHNTKWAYMNSSVTSIVAGELAHGAFYTGYEAYGVDILNRVLELSKNTDRYLHCSYWGKKITRPKTGFTPLFLEKIANADFYGTTNQPGVAAWTGEGVNDLHEFPVGRQVFHDVPFDIVDPAENGRRACLGLSSEKGYKESAELDVNQKARCLYVLHTTGNSYYAGSITLKYDDGSEHTEHIASGKIMNWWFPPDPTQGQKQVSKTALAWTGKNEVCKYLGVTQYGMDNPFPEKNIRSVKFHSARDGSKYMVLGVTLADQPAFFEPGLVSGGIPDNWGAAAVVYALIEGLAGFKDTGVAFDKAVLAPRWEAAGESEVEATAKYEASGGYLSYKYRKSNNSLLLTFTGSSNETEVRLLLPKGKSISALMVNDEEVDFDTETIESSTYGRFVIRQKGVFYVEARLA